MKLKIILTLLVTVLTFTSSYASFPVVRTVTNTAISNVDVVEEVALTSPAANSIANSNTFTTALLLWLFLGGLAAHRWYLGSPIGWNILFILTGGGLGIWWIIDGIDIITENYPGL
ncbi:MAG: hypothetical protein ACI86C_000038 [Candidatus Latescibacterota bacterium]|jgi:hypothetical protein